LIENLNKVLLVDDNTNDIELTKRFLTKHFGNLVFLVAKSEKDFDEKMSWVQPDLIISDFNFPDCTGLDLLMKAKADYNIPFIFLSGSLDDEDTLSLSVLNTADGYVIKDEMEHLPLVVEEIMKNADLEQFLDLERQIALNRAKIKVSKVSQMVEKNADKDKILDLLRRISIQLDKL